LAGATLGLIGLGSIGREVAGRASALGMRVIGAREHAEREKPPGIDEVFSSDRLDQMLPQCDYVVLAAPLTPATRGLMNARRLRAMKPDAYVINVGRGPLIAAADLVEALKERRIAGAALDVFEQEPLPEDSPLWNLDHLLITPHTAALTEKLWQRHYHLFCQNLRRYGEGKPLLFVVDKQKGY
jgi:phosphoglycerate dehydrogenase-like enzyme